MPAAQFQEWLTQVTSPNRQDDENQPVKQPFVKTSVAMTPLRSHGILQG